MKDKDQITDQVICVFLIICAAIGAAVGFIGLGVGLIFLSTNQAIGVWLLSTSVGAIIGGRFGCKAILRAIIKACEDRADEWKAKK